MATETENRSRNITAVLGPTNTGKTHLAIERMLGHDTGMIGLPLRLLAREIYDKIVERIGSSSVALITGEEKIKPESPRYWISTVEAMPRDVSVDFLAIDEIQLAADPERGHVFTDRLLHARGKLETLLLGAGTMREAISDLIPGANFISRPRLSKLTYSGQKKITRLPQRSAVVAFSASEVYAIAELMRRQRGGAAVVLGALSPRTRNAQVELYQSGDVDYMIATDAIGMGLNLDVDHVAFAANRKFDGQNHRLLTPAEIGQIAGRAGRHLNDGTFGVSVDVPPFDAELVERLESHIFDPVKTLQWRNRNLDFTTLDRLRDSLRQIPKEPRLARARMADDVLALEAVCRDDDIVERAQTKDAVIKLWDVCQVPDYRKISPQNHADLVANLFRFLTQSEGVIPEDWFARQVAYADRTDGDIDTLANRIAHIRTWTFVSNRAEWLQDPSHWQERSRSIEDSLSDALHERLTQRFVDRRTSALMKGLRANEDLSADIQDDGAIMVETHYVGRINGFRFYPDQSADGIDGKAARNAATRVLSKEFSMRARRVSSAKNDAFKLTLDARVLWRDQEIARLEPGEHVLKPQIVLVADEHLQTADQARVRDRLQSWLQAIIAERLNPLVEIANAEDISGLARGIAFRICENLGAIKREDVAGEIKALDQTARAQLRKYGVRFGAFNIFCPVLLKPAAADLTLTLWLLKSAKQYNLDPQALPTPPRAGLTSAANEATIPEAFYRAYGFHACGPRIIRLDILERLADLIRPLLAWRSNRDNENTTPPEGATGDGGFIVTPAMMSILGCSADDLAKVLHALGFRSEQKPAPVTAASGEETAQTEGAIPEQPPVHGPEAAVSEQAEAAESHVPIADLHQANVDAGNAHTTSVISSDASPAAQSSGDPQTQAVEPVTSPDVESTGPLPAPSQPPPDGTESAGPPSQLSIEIWRPKRKPRAVEGHRRRRNQSKQGSDTDRKTLGQDASKSSPHASGTENAKGAGRRRTKTQKPGARRKPRPSHNVATTNNQSRQANRIDPDSPFAALSALKEAMEKGAEDPSSTK